MTTEEEYEKLKLSCQELTDQINDLKLKKAKQRGTLTGNVVDKLGNSRTLEALYPYLLHYVQYSFLIEDL